MSPSRNAPRSRSRGFTLVELMVVISIIAVMASIALPRMQMFALKAKRAEREMMMSAIVRSIRDYAAATEGRTGTVDLQPNPREPATAGKRAFDRTLAALNPAAVGWDKLGFAPEGALYFRYAGTADLTPGSESLILTAEADLDNDGRTAVRTVTYAWVDASWAPVSETDGGDDW
jgi:prepilin-type N-terminal cleavage/methylation domain-containing protein